MALRAANKTNFSGCCFHQGDGWHYLPQISLKAHATILSSTSRTTLTQTFTNSTDLPLEKVSYKFPLYDGVGVVGFKCRVGTRYLHSKVDTKEQAIVDFNDAITNHQTAALMVHSSTENDVFVTTLGNVPANETIMTEITFIGELKQDAQSDGIRYTLPNSIAPRYPDPRDLPRSGSIFGGPRQETIQMPQWGLVKTSGIDITVDVQMEKSSIIRELQSPSHSVKVSLGCTSSTPSDSSSGSTFDPSQASASIRLAKENELLLERDFVLVVKADGLDNPTALLETHSSIPDQRALMVTLVPKFNLPPIKPEVIFVIDRSGSMREKIPTLRSALQIFLKSLPVGVCFNLCSFGSMHHFLWPQSKVYDKSSLDEASAYVETLNADMGGTNLTSAVKSTVASRLNDKELEVLILTDGQIHNQQDLFDFIRETVTSTKSDQSQSARFFSLGIGNQASHSLIEGIARSGNGISQSVLEYEELDRKVVRMLKGALTPHIGDFKLQVDYDPPEQDFEVVNAVDSTTDTITESGDGDRNEELVESLEKKMAQMSISLFYESFEESDAELGTPRDKDNESNSNTLPELSRPDILQAPYQIPPFHPLVRSYAYLLLDPKSSDRVPKSLTFSATSNGRPLQLRIPVKDSVQGETIHQLASRKAMIELEEQHSWLEHSKDVNGNPFSRLHADTKSQLAKRECQLLGLKYQVTGKHCSFVALEEESFDKEKEQKKDQEQEKFSKISDKKSPVKASTFNIVQTRPIVLESRSLFGGPPQCAAMGRPMGAFGPRPSLGPAPSMPRQVSARSGLFGVSSQSTPSPMGSFGSPQAFGAASSPGQKPPSGFGSTQSPSALFGGGQQHASGGSLFGGQQPQSSSPAFGHPSIPQERGIFASGFGASSHQQTQPAAGALFGGAAPTPNQPALFGEAPNDQSMPATAGLFGAAPTTSSSSLFGRAPNRQSTPATGGPFGNALSQGQASLFGSAPSNAQSSSAFGAGISQNTTTPNPGSPFGGASNPTIPAPASSEKTNNKSKVHSLIALQNFQGNWSLSQELCCEENTVRQRSVDLLGFSSSPFATTEASLEVLATLMAMGYLKNQHAEEKSVWELVFGKADTWLESVLPGLGEAGHKIQARREEIMSLDLFK
ncbi:unnamed protein product [Penicillium pancosmium]